MSADPLAPKTRLRTRVTAYFLLAALPVVGLSALGVVALDGLIQQEIQARQQDTAREARRIIDDEHRRVADALDRLAQDDRLTALALPETELEREDFEPVAAQLSGAYGLELLSIGALSGPFKGQLLSNAHLPAASWDDVPPYILELAKATKTTVALVHERVDGNPPALVPGLVSARVMQRAGRPAFVLFGGARLDGHRLTHVARAGQATLVLRSPGLRPLVFAQPNEAVPSAQPPQRIALSSHPGGRADVDPGFQRDEKASTALEIYVHTGRLQRTRALIQNGATLLGVGALLAALLAGTFLSRRLTQPIVELSDAARKIGAGDLDVQLAPRSRDEVGTLVRVFNRMGTELADSRISLARAERVAAWQQIARRVAHEIKNPLFPIQMSIETLQKSYSRNHPKLDEIVEESTRTVLHEVRALNRIVTEFSDFARLPTPKRSMQPVQDILQHVANLYRHSDGEQASVHLQPVPSTLQVMVDREQISRALINLVKNAQEAISGPGEVKLSAQKEALQGAAGVWLQVADDGPGMSSQVLNSLFTPYFTTKAEGTGLGLAIVDRIVSEHGGQVRVQSQPGEGTTIRLWLPSA